MRVLIGPFGWVRYPDEIEELHDSLFELIVGDVVMNRDSFGDLLPDREHRVEGRQGILEDHRDAFPAELAHLPFAEADQLTPPETDAPRHDRGLRQQTENGHRRHALARPGFADDAERLLGIKREAHIINRVHIAVVGGETH